MKVDKRIVSRIDALLSKAELVLDTHKPNPPGTIGYPTLSSDSFSEWRSQTRNLLSTVLGTQHSYTVDFDEKVSKGYIGNVKHGVGILRALREDIENGHLRQLKELVLAETFDEFLDMAEHLLDAGYKDPAASLCGAVLENGLRDICRSAGIKIKQNDYSSALNQKLAQHGSYNRLLQKRIEVWIAIRNNADHGKFDEYASSDVKHMVSGIQEFLATQL